MSAVLTPHDDLAWRCKSCEKDRRSDAPCCHPECRGEWGTNCHHCHGTPVVFYYCGCIDEEGHYVWRAQRVRGGGFAAPSTVHRAQWPAPWSDGSWDAPTARFEQRDGWSLLTRLDNTVDTRPGSHSTLIAHGHFTERQLCALLAEQMPDVHARLRRGGVL